MNVVTKIAPFHVRLGYQALKLRLWWMLQQIYYFKLALFLLSFFFSSVSIRSFLLSQMIFNSFWRHFSTETDLMINTFVAAKRADLTKCSYFCNRISKNVYACFDRQSQCFKCNAFKHRKRKFIVWSWPFNNHQIPSLSKQKRNPFFKWKFTRKNHIAQ